MADIGTKSVRVGDVVNMINQIMSNYKPKEFEKLFDKNWQVVLNKTEVKKHPDKSINELLEGIDLK